MFIINKQYCLLLINNITEALAKPLCAEGGVLYNEQHAKSPSGNLAKRSHERSE